MHDESLFISQCYMRKTKLYMYCPYMFGSPVLSFMFVWIFTTVCVLLMPYEFTDIGNVIHIKLVVCIGFLYARIMVTLSFMCQVSSVVC